MKVTMYHSHDEWFLYEQIPSMMCLICNDQKITIDHIVNEKKVLGIIKGRYRPGRDNEVIVTGDGIIIKDYFDLVKWIESNGLRLC